MSLRRLELGYADRRAGGTAWITGRGLQVALGVAWLLAGLLQFQSYMYTHEFVTRVLASNAAGQPSWIGGPITTFAHFYGRDLTVWNTLAAELESAIGLGLILSRRTVRPALAAAFVWSLVVWWLGEGFGLLTSNAEPSPLMGAPGAALIYALIGLALWPRHGHGARGAAIDATPAAGSLRGGERIDARVASFAWAALWIVSAVLWCLNINRSRNAIHDMLVGMASGSPHWLASWQNSVAGQAHGHGQAIALILAALSLLVGLGVFSARLRLSVVVLGIVISLAYWVLGQSLGGPFWAGDSTDVNTAPLFILLGLALVPGRVSRPVDRQPLSQQLESVTVG